MAVLLQSISGLCHVKSPSITTFGPDLIGVRKNRNSSGRRRIRVSVWSRIKDLEPWILNDVTGTCNSAAKPSKEDEEKQNYYVNTGKAIRTLGDEFPKLFYNELSFDIYRIMIRWTVHGIPWESRGRFDGTSEYKVDKNGKIRVHNIALNAPPKFQVISVNELIQSLGCPSTPKPTYFEASM